MFIYDTNASISQNKIIFLIYVLLFENKTKNSILRLTLLTMEWKTLNCFSPNTYIETGHLKK